MRKQAHWQKPIDKQDRIEDILNLLGITDQGDYEQLLKGLSKLTRKEIANLYHYLRK